MNKKLIVLILASPVSLGGCSLWPYKSDFDCKIPKGVHCKSLYEVNKMAERGLFDPERPQQRASEGSCCGGKQC